MRNKKLASSIVASAATLALVSCGTDSSDSELTLTLALQDNETSNYYAGAQKMADEVHERTDGQISINVVAGGSLGDERTTVEMAMNNDVDIATAANSVLTNWIPEMGILDQAFLWENAEQAHAAVDGPVGELIEEAALEHDLHVIGYMESGFRNVFANRSIESVEDFSGLRIRTMQNEYHMAAFEEFGALPVAMEAGEQFTALQQGTIDAVENATSNAVSNSFYDVITDITETEHAFVYIVNVMSDEAWESIPEDLREPFLEGIQAGYEAQREYLVEANEEAKEELINEHGIEFHEIDREELSELNDEASRENNTTFDADWQDAVDEVLENS